MQFAVFGDIEVKDSRGPISLGGPRQRTLLAYLLTRSNANVTAGSIVDVLWDGEAEPANPERAVQTYMSRLRTVLDGGRITTSQGGYLLRIDDGEFDAETYRQRIEQARLARRTGDKARAAALYDSADNASSRSSSSQLTARTSTPGKRCPRNGPIAKATR